MSSTIYRLMFNCFLNILTSNGHRMSDERPAPWGGEGAVWVGGWGGAAWAGGWVTWSSGSPKMTPCPPPPPPLVSKGLGGGGGYPPWGMPCMRCRWCGGALRWHDRPSTGPEAAKHVCLPPAVGVLTQHPHSHPVRGCTTGSLMPPKSLS